ncbi:hypothetical protein AVEN_203432-1 [Araneus ventricosus]|uniref:Uncharacterized protein n=1 Tax=Araneus ventricosus TaxID=182803 RepID=A0A4Y2XAP7_ARAVE|nr:hypothetical protein AVEN_203432-1 [Araneus ventricosus]
MVEQGHGADRAAGLKSEEVFGQTPAGDRRSGLPVPGSGPTIALRWAHRMLPRGLVSDRPWGFHARPLVRRAGSPVRQVVCWEPFGREHPV